VFGRNKAYFPIGIILGIMTTTILNMEFEGKERSLQDSGNNSDVDQILNDFKVKANISPDSRITIIGKDHDIIRSKKLKISYIGEHPVKTPELDQDVLVSLPFTAELHIDKGNKLTGYKINQPESEIIETVREELEDKLKNGKVFFSKNNENVSSSELLAEKKPFYIQKDDQGKQHLKRSYFD
jgi:hypothetical protein